MSFYTLNCIHKGSTRSFIQDQCFLMCVVRNYFYAEEEAIQTAELNGKLSGFALIILIENHNVSIRIFGLP